MTKRSSLLTAAASAAVLCITGARGVAALGEDSARFLTIDHYVRVTSKVPAIAGQQSLIYVREKVRAGNALRGATPPDKIHHSDPWIRG